MGFFKDFKDDFSQALGELLPGDDYDEDEEVQVNTLDGELDVEQELSKLDGLLEQVERKAAAKAETGTAPAGDAVYAATPEAGDAASHDVPQGTAQEPELASGYPEMPGDALPASEAGGAIDGAGGEAPGDVSEGGSPDGPSSAVSAADEPEFSFSPADLTGVTPREPEPDDGGGAPPIDEQAAEGREQADLNGVDLLQASEASDGGRIDGGVTEVMDEPGTDNNITKEDQEMDTMNTVDVVEDSAPAPEAPAQNAEITDEVSLITAGTSIRGNMDTTGSIEVEGRVEGDIKCNGKLTIVGVVNGNSSSSEFFADSAHVEGEVVSSGTVKVGLGSVIIGNITATSAVIAGAVKGDIDVQGPVVVDTSAVIMGNIKSRSVQINNGAVIEGFCSQCYADVDMESLFAKK